MKIALSETILFSSESQMPLRAIFSVTERSLWFAKGYPLCELNGLSVTLILRSRGCSGLSLNSNVSESHREDH